MNGTVPSSAPHFSQAFVFVFEQKFTLLSTNWRIQKPYLSKFEQLSIKTLNVWVKF